MSDASVPAVAPSTRANTPVVQTTTGEARHPAQAPQGSMDNLMRLRHRLNLAGRLFTPPAGWHLLTAFSASENGMMRSPTGEMREFTCDIREGRLEIRHFSHAEAERQRQPVRDAIAAYERQAAARDHAASAVRL